MSISVKINISVLFDNNFYQFLKYYIYITYKQYLLYLKIRSAFVISQIDKIYK